MVKKKTKNEFLNGKTNQQLITYLVIFVGCALAMIINLVIQDVSFFALSHGSSEQKELLLLTICIVVFCVVLSILSIIAIRKNKKR